MTRTIKTSCVECGSEVVLGFGDLSFEQALKHIKNLDKIILECPGFHVEIGGWRKRWQLDQALEKAYCFEERALYPTIVSHIDVFVGEEHIGTLNLDDASSYRDYVNKIKATRDNEEIVTFLSINYIGEIVSKKKMTVAEL